MKKLILLVIISSLATVAIASTSETTVAAHLINSSFEAISPDQKLFLTSKTNCDFEIGDRLTGKIIASYSAPQPANDQCSRVYPKSDFIFSPNSKYVFRSDRYSNGALFDITGAKLFTISNMDKSEYGTREFMFSIDSKYIILVGGFLYEAATFSKDAKRIKTLVQVWDVSGRKVFEEIHKDRFLDGPFLRHIDVNGNSLFFTPDDNSLIVKDFSGKKVMSLRISDKNEEAIVGLSVSPDSKEVLIRTQLQVPDERSKLYAVNLKGQIIRQTEFASRIQQASYSSDGKYVLLALSNFISNSKYPNEEIRILDLDGNTILKYDLRKEEVFLSSIKVSSDNKFITLDFKGMDYRDSKKIIINMNGEVVHEEN